MSLAQDVTRALGGQWLPGGYGMAPCLVHDDGKSPSLKISDAPNHDDGIDCHCFAGCDWQSVKAELRRRGLIQRNATAAAPAAQDADQRARDAERTQALIGKIWHECRPAAGTLVERYLSETRGLDLKALVWIPPTIRFHPSLRHTPTGTELPAMVSAIQGPDRKVCALHRTYLTHQGQKAPFSQNRMILGPCGGGAVRLAAASQSLMLAEGIETALAAMQIFKRAAWAALSTSGLRAIVLPPEVKSVLIAADNDSPGVEAAHAAAERFEAEGRSVRIETPPDGLKDWNDCLMQRRGAA